MCSYAVFDGDCTYAFVCSISGNMISSALFSFVFFVIRPTIDDIPFCEARLFGKSKFVRREPQHFLQTFFRFCIAAIATEGFQFSLRSALGNRSPFEKQSEECT